MWAPQNSTAGGATQSTQSYYPEEKITTPQQTNSAVAKGADASVAVPVHTEYLNSFWPSVSLGNTTNINQCEPTHHMTENPPNVGLTTPTASPGSRQQRCDSSDTMQRKNDDQPADVQLTLAGSSDTPSKVGAVAKRQRKVKKHRCEDCSYTAYSAEGLNRHIRKMHQGQQHKLAVLKCPHCDFNTSARYTIKTHIRRRHNNNGEKPFACPHCSHTTTDKNYLRAHIKSVHEKNRPYKCPHCPHAASLKQNLNTHIQRVHPGVKDNSAMTPSNNSIESQTHSENRDITILALNIGGL